MGGEYETLKGVMGSNPMVCKRKLDRPCVTKLDLGGANNLSCWVCYCDQELLFF